MAISLTSKTNQLSQLPQLSRLLFTLACSLLILTGCGGSGNGDDNAPASNGVAVNHVDTSQLSLAKMRSDVVKGSTQGVKSSLGAVSATFSNASVFSKLSSNSNGLNKVQPGQTNTASINNQVDNSLEAFAVLIDQSDLTQDGNVYRFNPREQEICASIVTAEKKTSCETVLSAVTFVVTVDQLENNEVTAATIVYEYNSQSFARMGFDHQSAYYQIDLAGTKKLLASSGDTGIPSIMEGSIRITSSLIDENSGSIRVSIPSALHFVDDKPGDEMEISLAATNRFIEITADGVKNTMNLELGLGVLELMFKDTDDVGNSYPVKLVSNAITGKMTVTENGDKLTLTGVSANAVSLKVDNRQALYLNLDSLSALLDSSGMHALYKLNSNLDFKLSTHNIRNYLSDSSPASNQLMIRAKAARGTEISDLDEGVIKVTKGALELKVNDHNGSLLDNIILSNECLNLASPGLLSCPSGAGL